jgi:hypothetical protein
MAGQPSFRRSGGLENFATFFRNPRKIMTQKNTNALRIPKEDTQSASFLGNCCAHKTIPPVISPMRGGWPKKTLDQIRTVITPCGKREERRATGVRYLHFRL